MNRDWIEESKMIALELENLGYKEEARKIFNAIEAGSTAGEILMSLRWNLHEILKMDLNIRNDLKLKIAATINGINKLINILS